MSQMPARFPCTRGGLTLVQYCRVQILGSSSSSIVQHVSVL